MPDATTVTTIGTEAEIYTGPEVASMCPAVAMGLAIAKSGQLSDGVVKMIREVSDRMTKLAQEEREALLVQWDRRIAAAKTSGRTERE